MPKTKAQAIPKDDPRPRQTAVWLYLGLHFNTETGAKFYCWEDMEGQEHVFDAEPKHAIPGCRYELTTLGEGANLSIILGSHKFKDRLPDDPRRASIMADHRTQEAVAGAWKVAKEGIAADLDIMTLGEVRAKLQRLPTPHRRALLAVVLTRIMGGSL